MPVLPDSITSLISALNKLPGIGAQDKAQLEEMARRIVNKLLHDPVSNLRQAEPAHGSMTQYLNVMAKLFDLEESAERKEEA